MQRQMLQAAFTWRAPYFCNYPALSCVQGLGSGAVPFSFPCCYSTHFSTYQSSFLKSCYWASLFPSLRTSSVFSHSYLTFWTSSCAGKCWDKEVDSSFTCLCFQFDSVPILLAVRKHRQVYNSWQSILKGKKPPTQIIIYDVARQRGDASQNLQDTTKWRDLHHNSYMLIECQWDYRMLPER